MAKIKEKSKYLLVLMFISTVLISIGTNMIIRNEKEILGISNNIQYARKK